MKPVPVPAGVTVEVENGTVSVKGPKGQLSFDLPGGLSASVAKGQLLVERQKTAADDGLGAQHGTARSIINNMILGVDKGYRKDLEIQGVGYKASLQGAKLVMSLGYSHPVEYPVPAGIKIEVDKDGIRLAISGADKQQVGDVAARLRSFCKAEPYKGKGIRYKNEVVRRKAGKTVA
jgi:large subunit ribosomal protein L6